MRPFWRKLLRRFLWLVSIFWRVLFIYLPVFYKDGFFIAFCLGEAAAGQARGAAEEGGGGALAALHLLRGRVSPGRRPWTERCHRPCGRRWRGRGPAILAVWTAGEPEDGGLGAAAVVAVGSARSGRLCLPCSTSSAPAGSGLFLASRRILHPWGKGGGDSKTGRNPKLALAVLAAATLEGAVPLLGGAVQVGLGSSASGCAVAEVAGALVPLATALLRPFRHLFLDGVQFVGFGGALLQVSTPWPVGCARFLSSCSLPVPFLTGSRVNFFTVNGSMPSSQARRQGPSLAVELGGHGMSGPLVIWRRHALPRRRKCCSCADIILPS
ncbi:uncharacterized protein [Triticum aestivum]|uniref:uncharacterized protein n=1 Tax=Triticum aestivum TaxID=4565 RepID=UPI001D02B867|nr:uncharacterized protein LOC123153634 [Triticum aestivum]